LAPVERPRAELHLTILLVEREKLDVHRARTLVDRRRDPQYVTGDDVNVTTDDVIVSWGHVSHQYVAGVEENDIRFVRDFVFTVSAARTNTSNIRNILLTTFVFRLRNDINVYITIQKGDTPQKTQYIGCNYTSAIRSDHFMRLLQYVRYSFVGFAGLTA